MLVQQVAVKLLARVALEQDPLIAVFHRWIREELIPGHLLVDVADYRHVPDGPGIMIIGHEAQIGLDEGPPGAGLLYTRRRDEPGDGRSKIREALSWAVFAADLLEREEGFARAFSPNDLIIAIRSRAFTPDAVAASGQLAELVRDLAGGVWPGELSVRASDDPRAIAQVRLQATSGFETVSELAAKLPIAG